MIMPTWNRVLTQASKNLRRMSPRGEYGQNVLVGWQRWSGGDLVGKARHYSASYARARVKARAALLEAGGCIVPVEHGRLVSAVEVAPGIYVAKTNLYRRVEGRKHLVRIT